jgi:outer membrane protein
MRDEWKPTAENFIATKHVWKTLISSPLCSDDSQAERNFKFARAGDLPPETKTIIDRYLNAIVRLRHWSYIVGVSLAGDTNANGATTARTIDLYGLAFTLSDTAREKSGLGAAADLAGEWSP